MRFRELSLDDLEILDEASFRHIELYGELKEVLRRDGYRFRVPKGGEVVAWDRVLFLNLTYWSAKRQGDFLTSAEIPADVVAHVAWHHLASKNVESDSAIAMFLGESIASAFDLYLIGRLLGVSRDAEMLATQVPRMAEAADAAGMDPADFEAMLEGVAADPERAFEDLRALLFEATVDLHRATSGEEAGAILSALDARRFAPLIHHYELSNWVLHAHAHAPKAKAPAAHEDAALAIHRQLTEAPDSLAWLSKSWLS